SAAVQSSWISKQDGVSADGAGMGVRPGFIGDGEPASVPIVPGRRITRSFWVVTEKDTHESARGRAFKDWSTGVVAAERGRLSPG
ncbi:hypothetical protein OY671_010894, partial [Metschnikowia pulcherrima]